MTPTTCKTYGDFTLRPYQGHIQSSIWDGWAQYFGQLIICPTGSGKTLTGLACCDDWLNANANGRIVWSAMRRELLIQAEKAARAMGLDMDRFDFVSTFTNEWRRYRSSKETPVFMMFDEAHHAACDTVTAAKNIVDPTNLLGLSATPARADHHALGFNRSINESNYDALIRDGYLSQYEHFTLPDWNPTTVSRIFTAERDRWGKSIVFFRTRQECEQFMYGLSPAELKRTALVDGNSDRETQLRQFHDGDLETLVNMNVLTEGYDEDSIDTVFARHAGSQTTVIQQAGRVMRLFEGRTKQVVQSFASKSFVDTATPKAAYALTASGWAKTSSDPNAIVDSLYDVSSLIIDVSTEDNKLSLRELLCA